MTDDCRCDGRRTGNNRVEARRGVEPGLIFFRARPGARKAGVSPRVASCDDVAAAAGAFLV
jgi:hypothetical protein